MDAVLEPTDTTATTTARIMDPVDPPPRLHSDTDLGCSSPCKPTASIVNGVLKISDLSTGGLAGSSSLLRLARENAHFTELDLTGCSISKGDELAEVIRCAPKLKRLILEWNNLGLAKTGIAALCSAIASCGTLKEVDLRSNRIGPPIAAALSHALRNNSSLTSLDLRWNEIGPSGATALIGMLERNRTLKDVQLSGNNIPSSLQSEIDRLLERNRAGSMVEEMSTSFSKRRSLSDACSSSILVDDRYERGCRAQLLDDLSKLRSNLESLKEECKSLQLQQESTNSHLEAVKNELKEESRLRIYVQKESQEFKEQATKAREDIAALEERLYNEGHVQNNILIEAREMNAVAMSQCKALQEEILRLKEEHSSELNSLTDRARKEAEYNLSLMNKMDSTFNENDQLYMDEIKKLHLRLSEESQGREDALKELEKHRSLISSTEQKWLEEKAAHEQALHHLTTINSDLKSLQKEREKLMRQISKMKKVHATEVEEAERNVVCLKQALANAEQNNADVMAERAHLLENIAFLEDKGKLLEKKLELERIQHAEVLQNELLKFDEERRRLEKDVQDVRQAAEQCMKEIQLEQDERKLVYGQAMNEAEAALSDALRQHFAQLRSVGSGIFHSYAQPRH